MRSSGFEATYNALLSEGRFNEMMVVDQLMDGIIANPAEFPNHPKDHEQQFGWTDPVPERGLPAFTIVFRVLDTEEVLFIKLVQV